jgi:Rab3 GTPase-activating protein catalytic subunit
MPLFSALHQEQMKGAAAKSLAASSAKWIVCSLHVKPNILSPLASALRFLFDNLPAIRSCSCIADVLSADSVMLFLQGSKAPPGSKTFVKALDDMFQPQPPVMQYEPSLMQCLRSLGCKASPPTSLFANFCRHAMFMTQVSDVGRLWAEFVRELRWYWENTDQLPGVCCQSPDHSTGYIEQKLCMLQVNSLLNL